MSVKIRVLFIMPCEQRPTNPSDLKKFDGRWTVQSTKHLGTTAKQTDRTAAALLPESDDGQLQSLGLEPVYGEYEDEWLQSFSCNSILPLRVLIRRLYAFICQKKNHAHSGSGQHCVFDLPARNRISGQEPTSISSFST